VLGNVGMALHHKLCHTLGGSFNLPHAEVHTVILPHAIAYNAPAIPEALERMRRALHSDDPATSLYDLARANGAPWSLRALGLAEADLDRATDLALANPYWNPRPIERAGIRQLLQNAWEGLRPVSRAI
jgi:maleylacetate reductase